MMYISLSIWNSHLVINPKSIIIDKWKTSGSNIILTPHKKIRSIDDFYVILTEKYSKYYIFEEKEIAEKSSPSNIIISGENEQ